MGFLGEIFGGSEKKEKYVPNFKPSGDLVVVKGSNQRMYVRSPKLMDKHPEKRENFYLQTKEDRGVAMKLFETHVSKLAESRKVFCMEGQERESRNEIHSKKEIDVDLPDISKNQEILEERKRRKKNAGKSEEEIQKEKEEKKLEDERKAALTALLEERESAINQINKELSKNETIEEKFRRERWEKNRHQNYNNSLDSLLRACAKGKLQEVQSILRKCPHLIDASDVDGWSPLHKAVLSENVKLLEWLYDSKGGRAYLHATTEELKWTVLHCACCGGTNSSKKMINLILSWKGGLHIDTKDKWGFTPLHLVASKLGHFSSYYQPKNFFQEIDRDPYFTVMKLLIKKGSDINSLTISNMTPLHFAAARNSIPAIKLLLQKGAHYLQKDSRGMLPMHTACLLNSKDAVRELLSIKPKISLRQLEITDKKDRDPLEICREYHNWETERLIVRYKHNQLTIRDEIATCCYLFGIFGNKGTRAKRAGNKLHKLTISR